MSQNPRSSQQSQEGSVSNIDPRTGQPLQEGQQAYTQIESEDQAAAQRGVASSEDLEDKTKEELVEMAKQQNISGYSNMNKDELVEALRGGGLSSEATD